jgi:hypothetical protein
MKELINKLKKLDQAKRIVIIFITISFVFIAGFSIYNGISGNYQKENTAQVTQIKDKKDKNTKKDKEEDKQENKEETNTQKEVNEQNEENNSQENTSKTNDPSKQETKKKTSTNTKQSIATTSNVETNSNQQSSSSTSTSSNNSQSQNDNKITVNIQVIGVDSTIVSGTLNLEKDTNVYNALKTIASQKGVSITTSGFGASTYVREIGGLKEFDYGGRSGWMYSVNDVAPNYGAYSYKLKDGDNVKWYYVY